MLPVKVRITVLTGLFQVGNNTCEFFLNFLIFKFIYCVRDIVCVHACMCIVHVHMCAGI